LRSCAVIVDDGLLLTGLAFTARLYNGLSLNQCGAMQISLSSALIGLVAGAAIGFIAATTLPKLVDSSVSGDSSQLQNSTQTHSFDESKLNNATEVAALSSATGSSATGSSATGSSSMPSGNVVSSGDINIDQLVSQKKYANGFSGELTLLNQIGQADFDELQSLAINLLDKPQQHLVSHSLQLIGLRMVELDRDETMHFLFSHFSTPSATRSIYEVHSIVDALAGTHYNELIEWADNLPDKQANYGIQAQILTGLARVNPEEALAVYSELNTDEHGQVLYSLLQGWSDADPQSAMMWALDEQASQSSTTHDLHPTEIVFAQWLRTDYESAKAFLPNVGDQKLKARLELLLINEMSFENPQAAIELAVSMEDQQSRSQAFESAFYGWTSSSLMDAIDYATHSLSGEDQERAYYIIGMNAGQSSPDQFGGTAFDTMVMTESLPTVLGEQIRMATMYQFFQEDAQAAVQWLDTVADPVEREQLLSTVAYDMAQTDLALAQSMFDQSSEHVQMILGSGIAMEMHNSSPESAWSWYEQLSPGHVKTSVLQGMIYSEAQHNPNRAMQLAMDNQGEQGEELVMSVFVSAAGSNYQWASDWLDQATISPDMAVQLRSMLENFRFGGHDSYRRFEPDRYGH